MQITSVDLYTVTLKNITQILDRTKDPNEKYKFLNNLFNLHNQEQSWLTRIKFHCSIIVKPIEGELKDKFLDLHKKIETVQTAIGHPPDRKSGSRKRTEREPKATLPVFPLSSPPPSLPDFTTLQASTFQHVRTPLTPTAITATSFMSPHRYEPDAVSPLPSSSSSSSSSDLLIDQLELTLLRNLCDTVRHWDPIKERESILKAIRHLIHFFEVCNSIKKEIAIQIAQLYFKIGELCHAKVYYTKARELGWNKAFWHLANIAFKEKGYSECVAILQSRLPIPEDFFDKHQLIQTLPPIHIQTDEEKKHLINELKLLANAYENLNEMIIATRLRELIVSFGDERMQKYLTHSLDRECRPTVQRIIGEDKAFREEVIRFSTKHRENPARSMSYDLIKHSIAQGYINTVHGLLKTLLVDIVANEALSRYLCFTNSQCEDSRSCSAAAFKLCQEGHKLNPKNGLIAWIFASMGRDNPPSNMNDLVQMAMEGGFSDPRISGANLYPVVEGDSAAFLSIIDLEDDFDLF